jgi:hypothetical protein
MDSRVPKNEREWWASREIEKLERELANAKEECDLNRTRLASIFWSGAMDKFTGGDVQKWAAVYTAELASANKRIADCEFLLEHRYKIIQRQESRCSESIARAEKAEADAERWSTLAKSNAAAGNRTEDERFNLAQEVKQLRAENAQLKLPR